ncbi:hypothetical protein F8O01_08080 [Pseudoclavibacter chungangensis]|uniref:Uncharacterized protein n=1 Tax=Pseudoclavibacter chungangensis TaxID=587635 RepID=A0A7J5BVK6_9MICO|nr:hypothetical protein [Pseudoclavibacter chungangensis]KAB1657882.1 hypothetical protein F8O01_08080 [Pseudoclavibacter chungangensis]NYJ66512.1 putative DNA-binding transcriptional regulator AlpA [Pseudoclavibacter chungangensis]
MDSQNSPKPSASPRSLPDELEQADRPLGRLYTIDDLVALTGLPKSTIYAFNHEGRGPKHPLRMGRSVRYFEP